ncbi:hypothetical protein FJZ36_05725 [Candidatus Poribacteria bacterium]|nr:hypothetical protein [Candidatus Poribacteria bacterium]
MDIKIALSLPPERILHLARKKARRVLRGRFVSMRGPRPQRVHPYSRHLLDSVDATIRQRLPIAATGNATFAATYRDRYGEDAVERVVVRGTRAVHREFDLLGSGPVRFDGSIPWHTDFKTGYSWRADTHHTAIYHMDPVGEGSDYKVPWELSRCHHFIALGQAYALTGDDAYAAAFADQLRDWIDHNPPEFGINWICAMDVGIRAVNWLWAYALMMDSETVSDDLRKLLLSSLSEHARFVDRNDEWGPLTNNHYLSNGAALAYCGLLLDPMPGARRWLNRGVSILASEALVQIAEDGGNREGSIPYHMLICELLGVPLWLCRRSYMPIDDAAWARVGAAFGFLAAYTKDNGDCPSVGDTDDGRLHPLSEVPHSNHAAFCDVGAALFDRPEWRRSAGSEEAFWLTGGKWAGSESGRVTKPIGFPESGYYVLRSNGWYVFVDAAPIGLRNTGGHGHNDALSFELSCDGVDFIIDSGTYTYAADPAARNRFRSALAHNAVVVDNAEPARLGTGRRLWTIDDPYRVRVIEWHSDADETRLCAEHDGYRRLPHPVTHRRRFMLSRTTDQLVVQDELEGIGEHSIRWLAHLEPGVQVRAEGRRAVLEFQGVCVALDADFDMTVEPCEISPSYGVRVASQVLVGAFQARLPRALRVELSRSEPQ